MRFSPTNIQWHHKTILEKAKCHFKKTEARSQRSTKIYATSHLHWRSLHFNIHFEPCSMESVVPYLSTKQWNAKMHFIVGFYLIASGVLLCIYRHGKKNKLRDLWPLSVLFRKQSENVCHCQRVLSQLVLHMQWYSKP